jgi:hypothetical protein
MKHEKNLLEPWSPYRTDWWHEIYTPFSIEGSARSCSFWRRPTSPCRSARTWWTLSSCAQPGIRSQVTADQGDPMSFWKSRPICSPIHFFVTNLYIRVWYCGKNSLTVCATSAIFTKTAQRKQSTNGRIFAQSGHPAADVWRRFYEFMSALIYRKSWQI